MRYLRLLPLVCLIAPGMGPAADVGWLAVSAQDSYLIAGHTDGAPEGCGRETVAGRVADLMVAVSAGRSSAGAEFFSNPEDAPFRWYSFSDPLLHRVDDFVAREPQQLAGHFASRHLAGDRMVLRGIDFIGWRNDRGTVGLSPIFFDYVVRDSVGGAPQTIRGLGKAEYHCASSGFVVMSLSTVERSTWESLFEIHLADADTVRMGR